MGGGFTKSDYVDLLSLLYLVFKQVQQSGVMSLEAHFEDPAKSPILSRYPTFLARHDAVDFLADSAKVIIVGGIAAHDLEALMDEDLQVHHHEALRPASALAKIGDALPGLGIVAAVLGVVITMGHIDGPVEEIGHHVGAALIGTFLGILLSYGVVQPIAQALEQRVGEDQVLLPVHQGRPARGVQGQPAGDRGGVRSPRAAALRAPLVQRDRAVLPRGDQEWRRRQGRRQGATYGLGHEQGPAGRHRQEEGQGGHGGHHGGAWKVAYADFVTAMMAFFLVMWLVGQSPSVKAAVGGYFRDPGVFETTRGGGVLPGGAEGLKDSGVTPSEGHPERREGGAGAARAGRRTSARGARKRSRRSRRSRIGSKSR